MKRTKYKNKFDGIVFNNRWKIPIYSRTGNWVYIGISERWFSVDKWEIIFSFFGFDLRIWFKRELKNNKI